MIRDDAEKFCESFGTRLFSPMFTEELEYNYFDKEKHYFLRPKRTHNFFEDTPYYPQYLKFDVYAMSEKGDCLCYEHNWRMMPCECNMKHWVICEL
ncbi:unnamed protein product [Dibothriocephalus latus]|uniref:Uncharacterized protein n=1 Tax=Dibothriocephalus latus TaxID=60516 RepID=A0A3P7L558_DIBLA|nr:unnamed protein product [Dibothriocephalus latus]